MNITFKPFSSEDARLWEEFQKLPEATFLTSLEWIEFQQSLGKELRQYLVINEQKTIGLLYLEISKRKLISYAYAPYNPIVNWSFLNELSKESFTDLFKSLYQELIKLQVELNVSCIRFDPKLNEGFRADLKKLGYKKSLAPAQAIDMWQIDLTKSEEELRHEMNKSTRYNINKGTKSGISFKKALSLDEVRRFGKLMSETTARKGFSNFETNYFEKQFESLNSKSLVDLFYAEIDNEMLAGVWINYHNDTAYYTHGASTSKLSYSKLRAPYPLQWFVMTSLKSTGYKKYNMWGVLPERVTSHSQSGVSSFKKSFGGQEINLIGPFEVGRFSLKYLLQRLLEFFIFRKDRY